MAGPEFKQDGKQFYHRDTKIITCFYQRVPDPAGKHGGPPGNKLPFLVPAGKTGELAEIEI